MTNFENYYQDLSTRTRNALVEARLKPEQLTTMADGEILAIEGIGDAGLEEIRAAFPPSIKAEESKTETTQDTKTAPSEDTKETSNHPKNRYPRTLHGRSRIYKTKKQQIKNESYDLSPAVDLLSEVSYGKHKTVELHLNVKETGERGEITLPHSTGGNTVIAIFNDEVEAKIKAGKINFDILLATPDDMKKIAPLARVLGPRGLMPNPKSNTIIADPEKRKQQLEKGATLPYRTEPKAPIIHLKVATLDLKGNQITENIQAVLKHLGTKVKSAYIKTTMSPSVRLNLK